MTRKLIGHAMNAIGAVLFAAALFIFAAIIGFEATVLLGLAYLSFTSATP